MSWRVDTGGGSLASATSHADASGVAAVMWTLGPQLGSQRLAASTDGSSEIFVDWRSPGFVDTS